MPKHIYRDSLNSVGDSWATISIDEESRDSSMTSGCTFPPPTDNDYDCDDSNLDDTLPVEALNEMDADDMPQTLSNYLCPNPIVSQDMADFRPVHCSSKIQQDLESFDFKPKFCSSKLESNDLPFVKKPLLQDFGQFKSPAPIIREIAKLKPCLKSNSGLRPSYSEEFAPQRCSTARNESELKLSKCPTDLGENADLFVPLRSSTGITEKSPFPADFTPIRASTGLHEKSTAFMPLRSSTGLNESAAFNPAMSSTAQRIDDSNIPEFKNLRLRSESNLL